MLTTVEEYQTFIYLLNAGAAKLLDDISPEELDDFHPMRTGHIEEFDEHHCAVCLGRSLSEIEIAILIHSSGKLSVKELCDVMSNRMGRAEVLDVLRGLESRWLLAFSRF